VPSFSHKCGQATKIFHFSYGSSNYESPCIVPVSILYSKLSYSLGFSKELEYAESIFLSMPYPILPRLWHIQGGPNSTLLLVSQQLVLHFMLVKLALATFEYRVWTNTQGNNIVNKCLTLSQLNILCMNLYLHSNIICSSWRQWPIMVSASFNIKRLAIQQCKRILLFILVLKHCKISLFFAY